MNVDWTLDISTVISAVVPVITVIMLFTRMNVHIAFIRKELEKLADIPLHIARHDERLKSLEK